MSDQDILLRRLSRSIRPPAQGLAIGARAGGDVNAGPEQPDAIIDESGNVRRLWVPGDPWTSDYYFGGG